MTAPRLLVIGCQPRSLGEALVGEARTGPYEFSAVITAGLRTGSAPEEYLLNVRSENSIKETLGKVEPDIIICTVGVNEPATIVERYLPLRMNDAFATNVIGPMEVLRHFLSCEGSGAWNGSVRRKFIAISSNSARIPRRGSLPYCASKAALSMALRVAARELAGTDTMVWGYEPGLLAGTPMTESTEQTFGLHGLHRMPGVGPEGLLVGAVAAAIIADVANPSPAFNGTLIPLDAGEL